jgi:RNA polymerase sigma factor (sigma-70 family)
MASGQLDDAVRRICRLAGADEAGDGQLLERFAVGQDERAFATLVRRHGPMVLGVCERVLGHRHDAEDAFQAAFLILFRRARSLKVRVSLASWLYKVTYHVALAARTRLGRRRLRELQVPETQMPAVEPRKDRNDMLPALDAELERLPEKLRAPIVLCYLEGRTNQEAARLLRFPVGTIKTRLRSGITSGCRYGVCRAGRC